MADDKVLVLRTCDAEMRSYGGFVWPTSGPVECPDWRDDGECGHGLHGALWGEGDGGLLSWEPSAKWLVVEVLSADVRNLDGKVKFPRGTVVFCGDRASATGYLQERDTGRAVIGGTATAGDCGAATAGDHGTATAGYGGTIMIKWWDSTHERFRVKVGYIGEDGLKPGVKYMLNSTNNFVEA